MFALSSRQVLTANPASHRLFSAHFIMFSPVGNLALSRALGDFCFKKNDKKPAEEQIVTGTYSVFKLTRSLGLVACQASA